MYMFNFANAGFKKVFRYQLLKVARQTAKWAIRRTAALKSNFTPPIILYMRFTKIACNMFLNAISSLSDLTRYVVSNWILLMTCANVIPSVEWPVLFMLFVFLTLDLMSIYLLCSIGFLMRFYLITTMMFMFGYFVGEILLCISLSHCMVIIVRNHYTVQRRN